MSERERGERGGGNGKGERGKEEMEKRGKEIMLKPSDFGFSDSLFPSYRPQQWDAVEEAINTFTVNDKRFRADCLPVGSGKTLRAMTVGEVLKQAGVIERMIYLTTGKSLQDQLETDFAERIKGVRGAANYSCSEVRRKWSNCKSSAAVCPYRNAVPGSSEWRRCAYNNAKVVAAAADYVSTNYAFQLVGGDTLMGDKGFGLLVADEAHEIEDILTDFLTVRVAEDDLHYLHWPPGTLRRVASGVCEAAEIAAACVQGVKEVEKRIEEGEWDAETVEELRGEGGLLQRLRGAQRVLASPENWVVEERTGNEVAVLKPVWVGMYKELLFRGVPYVMLMSGTLMEQQLWYLGIKKSDVEFGDWDYVFDVRKSPVYWVPSARMTEAEVRKNPGNWRVWLGKLEEVFAPRIKKGLSGVIHTVSWDRARRIMEKFGVQGKEYYGRMYCNDYQYGEMGGKLKDVLKKFGERAKRGEGVVLVSPSVGVGVDFRDELARFNVIAKMPFEYGQSRLMKARREGDKMYGNVRTAMVFEQMLGRGMRHEGDWCENFVVDDSVLWFLKLGLVSKWVRVGKWEGGKGVSGYRLNGLTA